MLIKQEEANKMYCPFKFQGSASNALEQIHSEWTCEGTSCMAWQIALGSRWGGDHGYCGIAGRPADIGLEPRSNHESPFKKRP
jgi:hypothetical protein